MIRSESGSCAVLVQADEYLQVVAGLGATIPALETVGLLVREAAALPSDFLRRFVTQCIASCESNQVCYPQQTATLCSCCLRLSHSYPPGHNQGLYHLLSFIVVVQISGAATRQVRMVCAFVGMLLCEQLGEMVPLLPAIQAFCIQHSRNR